jgi:hypothetical protein
MAPQVGFEPTTLRLTAECSAIELLRSVVCAPKARWRHYHSIATRAVKTPKALAEHLYRGTKYRWRMPEFELH